MYRGLASVALVMTACGTGSGSDEGGGLGALCGGETETTCNDEHYCEWPTNRCDPGGIGTCQPRPTACTGGEWICGCDGELYQGSCNAHLAGTDQDDGGGCEPPEGMFACGPLFCTLGEEYCFEHAAEEPSWESSSYACRALPVDCPDPATCDCLGELFCQGPDTPSCAVVEGGSLDVYCPGD